MYLGAFCITPGINGNVICFSLEKAAIFPYDVSFNARRCFFTTTGFNNLSTRWGPFIETPDNVTAPKIYLMCTILFYRDLSFIEFES